MSTQLDSTRNGFGRGMVKAAEKNTRIVALSADLTESLRLTEFSQKWPARFIQVGVAEQNLIGVAAGLAKAGLLPVATSFACFSPANSWGVIRTSVCYSQLPVVIVGSHAGLATGPDGATHQALEDVALMRVLPHMGVVAPADAAQAEQAIQAMLDQPQPWYLRLSRAETPALPTNLPEFVLGQAQPISSGDAVMILASGAVVHESLLAAQQLSALGISTGVTNLHTIKPIDVKYLHTLKSYQLIVTVEDHQVAGGLGGAVAETLSSLPQHPPLLRIGVDDTFGESGTTQQLWEKHGLAAANIVERIKHRLQT